MLGNKDNVKTEYKGFALKICIFLFLIAVMIAFILPEYKNSYTAALLDKVERLESIEGPKIVLIGNSNLVYGIDSSILEKELGMPVVNMGLHGGLGNSFHERMMKLNITEGDIYVVCHSTYWDEEDLDDPVLTWVAVEEHPSLWRLINKRDYPDMYRAFTTYFKHAIVHHANGEDMVDLARYDFNEYGDIKTYREYEGFKLDTEWYPMAVGENNTTRLNEWNEYLNERGATMVVAGYPIITGELTAEPQYFEDAQNSLVEALDCEYISDYKDYMYPETMFYGSQLHLTSEGADIRTRQLVEDLRNWDAGRF